MMSHYFYRGLLTVTAFTAAVALAHAGCLSMATVALAAGVWRTVRT